MSAKVRKPSIEDQIMEQLIKLSDIGHISTINVLGEGSWVITLRGKRLTLGNLHMAIGFLFGTVGDNDVAPHTLKWKKLMTISDQLNSQFKP